MYNFRTGVSCKNNLGQEAELTGVVIKRVNIETEEEDVHDRAAGNRRKVRL
ncbi:MAG: hypothetical protein ACLR7D_08735 [Lachnospira eligens]